MGSFVAGTIIIGLVLAVVGILVLVVQAVKPTPNGRCRKLDSPTQGPSGLDGLTAWQRGERGLLEDTAYDIEPPEETTDPHLPAFAGDDVVLELGELLEDDCPLDVPPIDIAVPPTPPSRDPLVDLAATDSWAETLDVASGSSVTARRPEKQD